jgi:hypothetical protein
MRSTGLEVATGHLTMLPKPRNKTNGCTGIIFNLLSILSEYNISLTGWIKYECNFTYFVSTNNCGTNKFKCLGFKGINCNY